MPTYPAPLEALITYLRRFPGVGRKTAERYAFDLLSWDPSHLSSLGAHLGKLPSLVLSCAVCGCLIDGNHCRFCASSRDSSLLCIVATAREAYSIEETGRYKGLYHVLGTLISPLEGKTADCIDLPRLKNRLSSVQEIIIALDSTLEGDATSLYLKDELAPLSIPISRLAFGLPVGSSLEYIDEGTLSRAFQGRQFI